jgi:hypothetical protein
MLEFQVDMRTNKSILLLKWLRIIFYVENDAYKTPILTYNKELDVLVSAASITRSDVEEESSPPYPKYVMTNLEKEMMNLEETTLVTTPHSITSSNELNEPPMAPNSTQYVRNKV